MELPSGFVAMINNLLGEEAESFFAAMGKEPVVSVRKNPRKPSDIFDNMVPVAWCGHGLYLDKRPQFTLDPLFHAGAYYVQDASSMIYYECMKRIANVLTKEVLAETAVLLRLSLLDLCAAPGGKTTAMIDALPDGSRVIANEYVAKRAVILKENLAKWGYSGVSVTNFDTSRFRDNGDVFDIVAVDAPCSGEGMMRKDPDAISQWTPRLVEECALLQRQILTNATQCVKPGGFLIYSTCTFNRAENEMNAEFIRDSLGMIPFDPEFPEKWNIPHGIDTDIPAFRFMPHKTRGEGLFLAIFRKPGEFIPSRMVEKNLSGKISKKIIPSKESKKKTMEVPAMEDILSVDFDKTLFPLAEVSHEQALAYLRRESIILPPSIPKGIVVVTYKGLPLGPAKNIGSRANNLYPKNWRILMR